MSTFRVVRRQGAAPATARLEWMDESEPMAGDVDVAVRFSAIGRREALAACTPDPGSAPVVLGSDLAGTVNRSSHPSWRVGDAVVATGHGLGVTHHGAWAERVRLPGEWLLPQPDGLTPVQAMAIGTPGLAAMQAALALDYHGVLPETGPVLVTGATGGAGALAILALACLGYTVTAATRRADQAGWLRRLGASDVITVADYTQPWPCGTGPWAAAVDCLGGPALAAALGALRRGGAAVALGDVLAGRVDTQLAPFTASAVALLGVDAVHAPRSRRTEAWERWGECVDRRVGLLARTVALADVVPTAQQLLAGRLRGRVVVRVDGAPPPMAMPAPALLQ